MTGNSKVLIIYTGGTIGMIEDPASSLLKPFNFQNLAKEVPELNKLNIQLSSIVFEKPLDSSNMGPKAWIKIAEIIEGNYNDFDGFVVLHGSDTMAFSASALSFMLEGLGKPVIFTGSQLPIGTLRTDGKENLITAIQIAGDKNERGPIVPEVAIYFENSLLRGNRTSKVSAEHFEAFQSPNYPVLAETGVNIKYNHFAIRAINEQKLKVRKMLENRIAVLKFFPGITKEFVEAVTNMKGIKALILETFGAGNAPMEPWLDEILRNLIDNGVLVVNITQCMTGCVNQYLYETGIHLEKMGVIGGKDLTFEAAITKTMYLIGCNELDTAQIKQLMDTNLRGEMT